MPCRDETSKPLYTDILRSMPETFAIATAHHRSAQLEVCTLNTFTN